jgi:hypothetical protein
MHFGEGFVFDLETAAIARIAPRPQPPDVIVIALDEDSLAHPKLERLPRALMASLHGRVLDALLDAEAQAIGYVAGQATAEQAAAAFVFCELDWLKVKGKEQPIAIYELLTSREKAGEAERHYVEGYHAALVEYRAGRFDVAEQKWRVLQHLFDLAGRDTPPKMMADRAAILKQDPPTKWDGVWVRVIK